MAWALQMHDDALRDVQTESQPARQARRQKTHVVEVVYRSRRGRPIVSRSSWRLSWAAPDTSRGHGPWSGERARLLPGTEQF